MFKFIKLQLLVIRLRISCVVAGGSDSWNVRGESNDSVRFGESSIHIERPCARIRQLEVSIFLRSLAKFNFSPISNKTKLSDC